ncbi:MAG: dTMP kinase [Pirellulaceae bacterium]|nr:dTMP kinase [Rhodopirellula sp.]|tara:strand:- start:1436 stop:2056 length:621 start_codon:yes stop_codon:yes gene_type:complete
MFFSFDGTDGVGKSTQIELFKNWLANNGHEVLLCRDPGSTELGERLRDLLLQKHDIAIDRRSEMFLYMTARTQMVEEVIKPALAAGTTVICDRFLLANIVYQGHAGGMEADVIRQVGAVATDGILPDLTFLLDMDVTHARGRMDRELDRIESQGLVYMEQVRQGFLAEAERFPQGIKVVDAAQDIDVIHQDIVQLAEAFLRQTRGS